ncbi:integral membrane protein [Rhizoctonia solani]|uniref:Integral membrane protein n=1 Tax=Rhizoctonia solani TaxID=456999 RepID=A0A8H7ICF1_9AGAM|nr:integral membrane protein [Rhizoctonia solani]
MSFGAIINIHWASKAQVSCGQVCNAQGAIQILGETAVALFTLAITLLTFISIVRGWAVKARVWVWGSIVFGVWAFGALWAGVGGALEGFYAPHRIVSLAYTITILPVSIVRWIMFSGGQVSAAASFVAVSIFNLSGVVNVGLILLTRTNVLGLDYQAKEGAESRSVGDLLSGEDSVEGDLTGFGGVRVVNQRESGLMERGIGRTEKGSVSSDGLRPGQGVRVPPLNPVNTDQGSEYVRGSRNAHRQYIQAWILPDPKAGGSRIPTVGGSRIPSLGGRNAMSEKGPAGEVQTRIVDGEKTRAGDAEGISQSQSSQDPKDGQSTPAATLKPNDGTKPTQPAAKKRALGSPPTSARKRQRLDLPLRSSERMNDPLDVIPPSSPRISRAESSVRVPSPTPPPPRAQERARSTTAFNIPLGDQSSLLGGAAMDISSAGLYSDFDNGETPSPKLTSVAHGRQTVNNTRRQSTNSTRRSSLTPKPRRRSATPRRSPKSTRQPSATQEDTSPRLFPRL